VLFISSSKIECVFKLQIQKEKAEQAKQAWKQQQIVDRALNKARKKKELQDWKADQERKRIEKAAQLAASKATKEEAKQQKAVSKQLLLEAKSQKKRPTNKEQQTSQSKASVLLVEAMVKPAEVKSTQTRSGCSIKQPQHLQGYNLE
jgi:hypothetical protein